MKKINLLIASLFTSVLITACSDTSTTPPPINENSGFHPDINVVYDNVLTFQQSYIRSLQLPSGAIKDNEQASSKITPYFANFAAMALLKYPQVENVEVVKKYIEWYCSKLNSTKNPITGDAEIEGSIYDYIGDKESTQGTYDSVDSYAATFLEVVMQYAKLSEENAEWLRQYVDQISLVASAMVRMIDTEKNEIPAKFSPDADDYLSVASFVHPAKYLMDNCEVNLGLKAAIWLKKNGYLTNNEDFSTLLAKNTKAIDAMYNKNEYNWEKSNTTDWKRFYADALAQLYPGTFGVEVSDADRKNRLYNKFNTIYKDWEKGVTFDPFPWTFLSYAAASINDVSRVASYMTHINSLNIKGQQKDYWYSGEAAFVILAIDRVENSTTESE